MPMMADPFDRPIVSSTHASSFEPTDHAFDDSGIEPAAIPLPKALVFFGALWLLGSWMISMGLRTPIHPIAQSFTPGVRMMLQCIAVGLLIGWPLLRLSQQRAAFPIRQTMLDIIVLVALSQVVLWPLRLVTVWTVQRTAAMDATLAAWLLVAGATVAAAISSNHPFPRAVAMFTCVLFCLFGPAVTWLGVLTGTSLADISHISPMLALHQLADGGSTEPLPRHWTWISVVAGVGIVLWIYLILRSIPRLPATTTATTTAAGTATHRH